MKTLKNEESGTYLLRHPFSLRVLFFGAFPLTLSAAVYTFFFPFFVAEYNAESFLVSLCLGVPSSLLPIGIFPMLRYLHYDIEFNEKSILISKSKNIHEELSWSDLGQYSFSSLTQIITIRDKNEKVLFKAIEGAWSFKEFCEYVERKLA